MGGGGGVLLLFWKHALIFYRYWTIKKIRQIYTCTPDYWFSIWCYFIYLFVLYFEKSYSPLFNWNDGLAHTVTSYMLTILSLNEFIFNKFQNKIKQFSWSSQIFLLLSVNYQTTNSKDALQPGLSWRSRPTHGSLVV